MRIVLLPSSYSPAVGGVEILTALLARHLQARGHDVEVWTARSPGDDLSESEVLDAVRVRRFVFALPQLRIGSLAKSARAAARTSAMLRAAAREFSPDLLHVQCFSGNGAYATALSASLRIPLVVTLQGETLMDDHDIYEHSVSLRCALRLSLKRAAVVTGCSAFVLGDARERFGLDMSKARVIFNGVDVGELESTAIDVPFSRYVLGLGRVVRKKGFDLLLEAFSQLSSMHPDVGLVIGGDGPLVPELRRQVRELGLAERVYLTGLLNRTEVADLVANAGALVVPSRIEPFGIVALEAWRAGVPVVASRHGGLPEFVRDGESGLIVDPFDPAELSSAIASVLSSSTLRDRLVAGARRQLGDFGWPRLAARYEALYESGLRAS